jgi:Tfp pilus assembly protein PilF
MTGPTAETAAAIRARLERALAHLDAYHVERARAEITVALEIVAGWALLEGGGS